MLHLLVVPPGRKKWRPRRLRFLWQADAHLPEVERQAPPLPGDDDEYLELPEPRRRLPEKGAPLASAYAIVDLEYEESMPLLGVLYHESLSSAKHIEMVLGIAEGLLEELRQAIRACGHRLPRRLALTAWTAHIRAVVEWSTSMWGFVPKALWAKLESLQRRAAAVVMGGGDLDHAAAAWVRRILGLERLEERALCARARLLLAGEVMAVWHKRRGALWREHYREATREGAYAMFVKRSIIGNAIAAERELGVEMPVPAKGTPEETREITGEFRRGTKAELKRRTDHEWYGDDLDMGDMEALSTMEFWRSLDLTAAMEKELRRRVLGSMTTGDAVAEMAAVWAGVHRSQPEARLRLSGAKEVPEGGARRLCDLHGDCAAGGERPCGPMQMLAEVEAGGCRGAEMWATEEFWDEIRDALINGGCSAVAERPMGHLVAMGAAPELRSVRGAAELRGLLLDITEHHVGRALASMRAEIELLPPARPEKSLARAAAASAKRRAARHALRRKHVPEFALGYRFKRKFGKAGLFTGVVTARDWLVAEQGGWAVFVVQYEEDAMVETIEPRRLAAMAPA